MKVEFLKTFSKDLDNLQLKTIKNSLIRLIQLLEDADALQEIPHTKKLRGHKNAYRIRIGDYRLGLFLEHPKISLARFLHRKDIYKMFP
jgi:mRNA interferase RelE/StbE